MIDKVLGFDQPAPRRRRADNTSQGSSRPQSSVPSVTSPARSNVKKPNIQEITVSQPPAEEPQEVIDEVVIQAPPPVVTPVVNRSRPKINLAKQDSKQETKSEAKPEPKVESEEEIASPAVKKLGIAHLVQGGEGMKSSGKIRMRQSMRASEFKNTPPPSDSMYKLKLIGFLVVSFFLMIYAMTPARKAHSRRK